MNYTGLNTILVEHFGNLERLCNQIYDTHHGVTSYIEEMETLSFRGGMTVTDWNNQLNRLKEVRHKRNLLSHGEVSFQEQLANEDDIRFVDDFRNSILNQTDPLATYRKRLNPKNFNYSAQNTYQQPQYSKETIKRNSSGCLTAIFSIVFIAVCIIIFLL